MSDNVNLEEMMVSIIQRIATGPHLSKDINQDEARLGMKAILEDATDPVRAGIFLIALRMKRETDEEFRGVLQAILDATHRVIADVDEVLDIADPYDGYNRCIPSSPFLAPLMAECGVPAVSHGLDSVGPKYGITHRHVFTAAGVNVDVSPADAAKRIADDSIGWSYVDQAQFVPQLHDMIDLRKKMIKRSAITTVEVLAKPIVGRNKTHFMTGYVHKPYPPIYAMLARHAGFDSAMIVRGIEGGITPSLRQASKYFAYHDKGEEKTIDINPGALGIGEHESRAVAIPADVPQTAKGEGAITLTDVAKGAEKAAELGMAALQGEKGATYDSLVYMGAMALDHLGKVKDIAEGSNQVRAVLDSGKAAARVK